MRREEFKIVIDAPREKVWNVLWGVETYPIWTAPFSEGSKVETDWKEGSKVLFLDASNGGMVARIAKNIPNEFMSIEHTGMIENGVEKANDEKHKEWEGSLENYTLKTVDGKTHLTAEMDVTDEYEEFFKNVWPLALGKIKELSEEK